MQESIAEKSDFIAPGATGDPLIKVDNLGKIFCRDLKRALLYGLIDSCKDMLAIRTPRKRNVQGELKLRKHEFWANRGISFELRKGECLGLIGHNGAGKTTLLRMLNGLIKPDEGRIEIRGRVGALIALGAGFNPVLTGRENVYTNGSLLGMTKAQITEKFDDIIAFADIGKFIDSPVQNYSSGMRVRLGFAIASTLETDILIVDEVLAVGDFSFKQKCLNRITSYREAGGCIIFVSHNLNQIQMVCNKGIYLSQGGMLYSGEVEQASNRYFEDIQKEEEEARKRSIASGKPSDEFPFTITDTNLTSPNGGDGPISNRPAIVSICVEARKAAEKASVRLVFLNKEQGLRIATLSTETFGITYDVSVGSNRFEVHIKTLPLVPENYSLRVVLLDASGVTLARKGFDDAAHIFRVANGDMGRLNLQNQFGDIVTLEAIVPAR